MATYKDLIQFLDDNPGVWEYGQVAKALGGSSEASRGVGSMLSAIHRRGLHEYCIRVINKTTRQHNCDAGSPPNA